MINLKKMNENSRVTCLKPTIYGDYDFYYDGITDGWLNPEYRRIERGMFGENIARGVANVWDHLQTLLPLHKHASKLKRSPQEARGKKCVTDPKIRSKATCWQNLQDNSWAQVLWAWLICRHNVNRKHMQRPLGVYSPGKNMKKKKLCCTLEG